MLVEDKLTGRLIRDKHQAFIDKVIKLKNTKGVWAAIDLMIKEWEESNPQEFRSYVVSVEDKKETRETRYGSNKQKTIRQTVDFPQEIQNRIRAIYKADELPFDKKFFKMFWERYPQYRVAEKY